MKPIDAQGGQAAISFLLMAASTRSAATLSQSICPPLLQASEALSATKPGVETSTGFGWWSSTLFVTPFHTGNGQRLFVAGALAPRRCLEAHTSDSAPWSWPTTIRCRRAYRFMARPLSLQQSAQAGPLCFSPPGCYPRSCPPST